MRPLLVVLVWATSLPLPAQITGVPNWRRTARILATTAQQAILTYSAPNTAEGQPCVVEVSPSSTYSPLVPDVNGVLFPGANLDSRPGSYANGLVHTVTIGRRSVETASDGKNYSRSLGAATTYYYRITCPSQSGSSIATGAFATGSIPAGQGYGDPLPIDPKNPGSYLYPALSSSDRSDSTVDPHTGAIVKNMVLPHDLGGTESVAIPGTGTPQLCHPTPVKASDESKYGYHCLVSLIPSAQGLYWIASDGEARFLGVADNNYVAGHYNPTPGALFDITTPTPNNFYWFVTGPGSNNNSPWSKSRHYLLKGTYTGHSVKGQDTDLTGQAGQPSGGLPHTTFSVITPSDTNFDRSIEMLIAEFDPNWTTYGIGCCSTYVYADFVDGKLQLHWWNGQNKFGWVAFFDLNATAATQTAKFGSPAGCIDNPPATGTSYRGMSGCFVASMGTFTGGPGSPFRYSALHNLDSSVNLGSGMERITLHPLRQDSGSAYQVVLPDGMPASGMPCALAQPAAASYITDWPGSSWAPGCSTITVTGEPTLTPPINGYPASWPAAPGDLVAVNSATPGELARLLDKGSDGKTWYIQRQYMGRKYESAAPGGTLDMLGPGYSEGAWWDYINGPLGTTAANTYLDNTLGSGHFAFAYHPTYGRWSVADTSLNSVWPAVNAQQGLEPARFKDLSTYPVSQEAPPGFNGVKCAGNSSTPCAVESHPSMSILDPPDSTRFAQVINNRPYTGDYDLVGPSTVTPVSGQLYRIRGTSVLSNYKKIAYFAHSGNRAMREVSGPSAAIPDDSTGQFQWCVAYRAGECYSGSLAGDIYFNAPGVTNPYCTNNWQRLQSSTTVPNDICVSPAWNWTQGITIQQLEAAGDVKGATARTISNSFGQYEGQLQFWTSRTIPDGSWLFSSVASDQMIKLFKIPPMVRDVVDRTAYVPVTVTLPATAGADGAVVEFGYAEQGEGQFYCTARRESCVAATNTINPAIFFYFEGEAYTPDPCAWGCSIMIPGISGRIVEYRFKMFSGSRAIYTSPLMVAAVP